MTDEARGDGVSKVGPPASDRGVYGISVAAELSGISEQSLRLYERQGLLTPARSAGGTRRYSADDLARLQRISELVTAGVNLAGIDRILSLEDRNTALDERNVTLEGDNDALRDGEFARTSSVTVVTVAATHFVLSRCSTPTAAVSSSRARRRSGIVGAECVHEVCEGISKRVELALRRVLRARLGVLKQGHQKKRDG